MWSCENCGTENQEHDEHCQNCDTWRSEQEGNQGGEVCGDSYDHDVVIDHKGPDGIQWHCARAECGVEVWDPAPITTEE